MIAVSPNWRILGVAPFFLPQLWRFIMAKTPMRVAVTVKDADPTSVAVTGRAVIVFSTELIL